jgi:DNA uptake protein ComE-like DNA-binding protein
MTHVGAVSITPEERKAVVFLASLLLLGAAARAASTLREEHTLTAAPSSSAALASQLAAVDSERSRERAARQRPSRRKATRGGSRPKARPPAEPRNGRDSSIVIDVDRAAASELEVLPRIGPKLAQRIVEDRNEHGAFGSLTALMRVKGIGPKLVTHLAPHVTFSGSARPTSALSVSLGSVPRAGRPPPPG